MPILKTAYECAVLVGKVLPELIASAGTIAALYIAWSGLKTWRKQLTGRTNHEVARRVLRAVFDVREAIGHARQIGITGSERTEALRALGVERLADSPIENEEIALTLELRWNKVADALQNLHVELLEAEVLWGSQFMEKVEPLEKCTKKLAEALFIHADGVRNEKYKPTQHEFEALNPILYRSPRSSGPNTFEIELEQAIREIKVELKRHIVL